MTKSKIIFEFWKYDKKKLRISIKELHTIKLTNIHY